ncbi:HNH endonuclease signature motif containing protein [Ilumatobacter nonamiensis]|uniref:HNH endonuclease signature motif containing protein n=1 Tax=Ilumatobacter nonamiensis TaxID=467093 RepID=UPI00034641CD|nr:HNH endonuclease signature motif containing protein [Ilumatobacter nonamiensis]
MSNEGAARDAGSVVDLAGARDVFATAAGHLNAQHGRLVEATIWLLANEGEWQGDGLWNPEAYIRWRTGVGPGVASKIADVARRAHEFPTCVEMLKAGELSLDQIAPIVRHAPGWSDSQIGQLAAKCTVAQISKVAREYSWSSHEAGDIADPTAGATSAPVDGSDASEASRADEGANGDGESTGSSGKQTAVRVGPDDEAWFGWGDDGRFRLHANVAADTGLVLEAALTEARDALFRRNGGDVDTVDVLTEIADRSLAAVSSPARRNRFRVNVHVDRSGRATDGRGRPLDHAVTERIMCDALLSPVAWEDAAPVSVGRTQHVVPDRTRRLVEHRDGGCRVPGCHTDRFVEVHHIRHWSEGGPTDTANLICLCPRHHRLHHRGLLGIAGNADDPNGMEFRDGRGTVLTDVAALPPRPGTGPPPIRGSWNHPLGERLDFRWVGFTRPRPKPPPS